MEYEPSEGSSGAAEDTPEGTPRGTTTQLHSNKLSSGDDASAEDAPDIDSYAEEEADEEEGERAVA